MEKKVIIALIIILAILALLFFTPAGDFYSQFFKSTVGRLTGVLPATGEAFTITLNAKRTAVANIYNLPNSTVDMEGFFSYMKIGEQLTSFSAKEANVTLNNFNGKASLSPSGSLNVVGEAGSFVLNGFQFSSEKPFAVEFDLFTNRVFLSGIEQDSIVFDSLTGEIKKVSADKTTSINLVNEKLEIKNFFGSLILNKDGNATLVGSTNSVTGENFSFR